MYLVNLCELNFNFAYCSQLQINRQVGTLVCKSNGVNYRKIYN